jgi:predicted ribosomally synthesized peptide with SipW-like signal peptide/uncharacterized repeat protein (TIGR02543 family)
MKSRILSIVLIVGIAAALIGGLTMAWFTDDAVVASAEFKAGTVKVSADGPNIVSPPLKHFKNVNPGDCATVIWTIKNTGTKAVALKVNLSKAWEDGLSAYNVFYSPLPGSGWVMYDNNGELLLYYTGSVRGTFNYGDPDGALLGEEEVELKLVVAFDGVRTEDEYQGKKFTLGGTIEAIQASNNAPGIAWGNIGWTAVNTEGYIEEGLAFDNTDYFRTGPGNSMPCWEAGQPAVPKYTVAAIAKPESGGTALGSGTYAKDASVTLTATANDGYNFVNWTSDDETVVSTDASFTFTVTGDVKYTANFEAISAPEYTITVTENDSSYGQAKIGSDGKSGTFAGGTGVTLNASPKSGYRFVNWTLEGVEVSTDASTNITVTVDATYTANFEEIPKYTVTVDKSCQKSGSYTYDGTVKIQGDGTSGTFVEGTQVTITATPTGQHSKFAGWYKGSYASGNLVAGAGSTYTFTVTENVKYVARFERN